MAGILRCNSAQLLLAVGGLRRSYSLAYARPRNCSARWFAATSKTLSAGLEPVGAQLIPLVNKLHEVAAMVGKERFPLDLPQMVVIGSQSSGKSSVLEGLVGRDFLPRGTGLVTRCPVVLQLNVSESDEEYGVIEGRRVEFSRLSDEIMRITNRVCGKNKGISSQPIVVKVYSPHVLPLTLVDTPGATRVPVGDQPADIERQIRKCIHSYIESDNTIILAVHAANQDLATSDALAIAREVDRSGARTLGVLTKMDIMDRGADPAEMLAGAKHALKYGFIGVVNRSQRDILEHKRVREALEDETRFFADPKFDRVRENTGTPRLALRCNELLTAQIRRILPSLRDQVSTMLIDAERELDSYGAPLPTARTKRDRSVTYYLTHLVHNFSKDYCDALDGKEAKKRTPSVGKGESALRGGARLRHIFTDVFAKSIDNVTVDAITDADIRMAVRNAAGAGEALFVPPGAFEHLVRDLIRRLEEPAIRCADMVATEMLELASSSHSAELRRFDRLRERIVLLTGDVVRANVSRCKEMVHDLIAVELAFINTGNEQFIGGPGALQHISQHSSASSSSSSSSPSSSSSAHSYNSSSSSGGFLGFLFNKSDTHAKEAAPKPSKQSSPSFELQNNMSDREAMQVKLMRSLLESYFGIARSQVKDLVIKSCMHFVVLRTKEELNDRLLAELHDEKAVDELLVESERAVRARQETSERIAILRKAQAILQSAWV